MAIIENIRNYTEPQEAVLNIYPNQFVSDKEKATDDWVKINLDYFYTIAVRQYTNATDTWVRNYELLKGILRKEDFYEEPMVKSFTETLMQDVGLPAYVKHYPILNAPLNTMVGEMTKRPDNARVKAFDDDSKNEEMQFRTEILQKYIYETAKTKIIEQLAAQGLDTTEIEEAADPMTEQQVAEYLTTYTSMAERWGARKLEALKMEFNMKEQSEEAFRDLLAVSREYFHVYEDKSGVGFRTENVNPKNIWYLTTPDRKYTRDAYAAGTVEVLEISEILHKYDLTAKEIDHLKKTIQRGVIDVRESNLLNPKAVGINSITYDTYNPLMLQDRMLAESAIHQNHEQDQLANFLGITNNIGVFGEKFVVIKAYWISKKKVGKLTYIDQEGIEQVELVDEYYKQGAMPGEVSVEWTWVNQWYQGVRIGRDIYYCSPLELLDYCPIIGVVHESRNTEARSLVDLMKPMQMIYNVCMNQLWRLLEKEIGVTAKISLRKVPTLKDGDDQDSLEQWMEYAREEGIMFEDESIENTKVLIPNTSVAGVLDLSRGAEMQSRYNLAAQIKAECWELVGLTRQRMGGTTSSETATAINTALTQSYAQTETYFVQHEYVMNQVYQAMLDAAMYIESQKPQSTVSYISTEGESAFIQVNGDDLKLRDLKVYVTSRAEDQRFFNELRQLAQPMLQNGASPYEIAVLYSTTSVREYKDILKRLKDKQDALIQQQQEMQQQQIAQQQEIAQQDAAVEMQKHQDEMMMRKYEIDTKANVDLARAQIQTYFTKPSEDANANQIPDTSEIAANAMKNQEMIMKRDLESMKVQAAKDKATKESKFKEQELKIKEEELKVKREDIASKERIAKTNRNKFDKK